MPFILVKCAGCFLINIFLPHQVMLEAKWPSRQSKAHLRWMKIRNVVIAVAQFRKSIRWRSLSLYSNSGSELDKISHASVDSCMCDGQSSTSATNTATTHAVSTNGGPITKSCPAGQQSTSKTVDLEPSLMSFSSSSTPAVVESSSNGGPEAMSNKNNGSLEERMSTGKLNLMSPIFLLFIFLFISTILIIF